MLSAASFAATKFVEGEWAAKASGELNGTRSAGVRCTGRRVTRTRGDPNAAIPVPCVVIEPATPTPGEATPAIRARIDEARSAPTARPGETGAKGTAGDDAVGDEESEGAAAAEDKDAAWLVEDAPVDAVASRKACVGIPRMGSWRARTAGFGAKAKFVSASVAGRKAGGVDEAAAAGDAPSTEAPPCDGRNGDDADDAADAKVDEEDEEEVEDDEIEALDDVEDAGMLPALVGTGAGADANAGAGACSARMRHERRTGERMTSLPRARAVAGRAGMAWRTSTLPVDDVITTDDEETVVDDERDAKDPPTMVGSRGELGLDCAEADAEATVEAEGLVVDSPTPTGDGDTRGGVVHNERRTLARPPESPRGEVDAGRAPEAFRRSVAGITAVIPAASALASPAFRFDAEVARSVVAVSVGETTTGKSVSVGWARLAREGDTMPSRLPSSLSSSSPSASPSAVRWLPPLQSASLPGRTDSW